MIQKFYALLLFMALSATAIMGQETITVTDADLTTDDYVWETGNTYILDGYVYLEGGSLTIQPGVIVKGKTVPTPPITDLTSALIITRDAQIFAEGTADNPIIFTAEIDPLDGSLDASVNQLWGGLLILGNAPIGEDVVPAVGFPQDNIEGIPSTETRTIYGGTDPEDDSGVVRYVSIRHGGSIIAGDNEINGLTMGGVGSDTEIDYVEVFANKDDGIEIFGGTVNVKHAVVSFCGDDGLDFDESWDGFVQFAMTLTDPTAAGLGEHSVEYDGSESTDLQPQTTGRIYNATFIGAGQSAANTDSRGIRLRNDAQAQFWNCIWTEHRDYVFRWDDNARELVLANNIVWNYGGALNQNAARPASGFTEEDPALAGLSWSANGGLDPRLDAGSPALTGAAIPAGNEDGSLVKPPFRGAFGNELNWADGWTALSDLGYFGDIVTPEPTELVTLTDDSINEGETVTLDANVEYLLDGFVFVEEGATLVIPAGTVIRGKVVPSTGELASALIIARGGRIEATGTAEEPIIMTTELDDLSVTNDLTATDNQLWGGLIILGNAPIGEDINPEVGFPTEAIEGIPTTEERGIYGGTDPEDDSGIITYVSVRHGGSILGADNEINGITMGGVGSETVVDYVEVFANKDDGIEIFGGTVNVKHAVVGFCGDDALDFDESWDGFIQFAMTITAPVAGLGEHAVEYDGSEAADLSPQTTGRIYNGTFIGAGESSANADSRGMRLRNDAQAQMWNCIWTEMTDYVFRWDDNARELVLANNIVGTYGGALNRNDSRPVSSLTEEDPTLAGISWSTDGGLDPRLDAGSPALTGAAIPTGNEDGSLVKPPFRGAFGNELNWADGWTAMSSYGYFGDIVTPEPTELVTLTDASINEGETVELDANVEYLLDGFVFVEEGATLIIPAGTVIRGKVVPSTGELASALIIARGGRIEATGTAEEPIIMTTELDDLSVTNDLTATDNQLWGGLIILGNAPIGEDVNPDVGFPTEAIEGIPTTEERGIYGGTDPEDDSGIITYVSVRHGGSILGADNEINGITMGGVGSETVVDYVEVFANKDDGIEIFGGTVNVKHAVVGFCGDDALDFDESWDGFIQFAMTITAPVAGLGEHAIEYDGSESADLQPQTTGRIYNGTFIGAGESSANADSRGMRLRNDAQAQMWNCIWTEITDYVFRWDDNARDLVLANNIVGTYGGALNRNDSRPVSGLTEEDPTLAGISWSTDGGLDPRLDAGSPALTGAALPGTNEDGSLIKTPFRGAFGNELNWADGWTAMSDYGYFGDLVTPEPSQLVTIKDEDIEAGQSLILDANNEYILDGYVFVEEGATLIIPAGTVIRGKVVPSTGELASALIIARGGRIEATGTAEEPIIMTTELDDLTSSTDLTATDNQLWGGLIILGNAPIGEDVNPEVGFPTESIEGIPTTEERGVYGGTDPEDDSGIITYISVRHAGSIIGADNEINGITMGGVGSGTTVDHVEVFANKDDGIEIFGGTVNVTHAVVAFCGDDALDFDESWAGSIQFAFTITAPVAGLGEHAVEYDGSEATDLSPQTTGRIFNATFIGAGESSANSDSRGLRLRNDAQAQFWNCIWTEMTDYAFRWDDNARTLTLANNVVYNIGGKLERNDRDAELSGIVSMDDPMLGGVAWEPNMGLDPRLDTGSYALTGAVFPENDPFATVVDFHGAFGNTDNWADGWTALAEYGYFGDLVATSTVDLGSNAAGVSVAVPYPSPAYGGTVNIDFELPNASEIALSVMDMSGRVVSTRREGVYPAGQNVITMDVSTFKTGTFILAVHTELGTVTRKFSVMNQR
jgi:hypothetical protein